MYFILEVIIYFTKYVMKYLSLIQLIIILSSDEKFSVTKYVESSIVLKILWGYVSNIFKDSYKEKKTS